MRAELRLVAEGNKTIAVCMLRPGRTRRWHFSAFAALATLTGYHWLGLAGAGLVLLGFYARWQTFLPPPILRVRAGMMAWMAPWALFIPRGWGRYQSVYRDELRALDYVRIRRALLRATRQASQDPLDLPAFERV